MFFWGDGGAGTSTTIESFAHIFRSLGVTPATVEGDSFHRYSRQEMDLEKRKAREDRRNISYFGDEANDFDALENLFKNTRGTSTPHHPLPPPSMIRVVSLSQTHHRPNHLN